MLATQPGIQTSEAKLEITGLAVLQGKAQLQKAMRQTGSAKAAETAKEAGREHAEELKDSAQDRAETVTSRG